MRGALHLTYFVENALVGVRILSTLPAERELLASQPRHRWTVAEYHRMGEVGLLNEDSRIELIDGELIEMAPME